MGRMRKEYYAHSENKYGKKHSLKDHLLNTAKIAESFIQNADEKKIIQFAGLLHDLGKYQVEFQYYLEHGGKRGSIPHACWGSMIAYILGHEEVSFVIDGHHAGLPDESILRNDHASLPENMPEKKKKLSELLKAFFNDTGITQDDLLSNLKKPLYQGLEKEIYIRLMFSALTDADWIDTESHFSSSRTKARKNTEIDINLMIEQLMKKFSSFSMDGEINYLRNKTREEALTKAQLPPGFYSLNLPTGLGKTLTSFCWALFHARENSLKRIIIVLPFINIIDQTAGELKAIFGAYSVLEHHSLNDDSIVTDDQDSESQFNWKRLACENWDYPVIITTTVQFFESLFSNRPSRCRKIHNISESIVIFDEVQSLPKEIVIPTLTILKNVQHVMRASFLFCTATLPAFSTRDNFDGIYNIISLVENQKELFEKTKRVRYIFLNNLESITLKELEGNVIKLNNSTLVVLNTKKDVMQFYQNIKNNNYWKKVYHLSTRMCPCHRKLIINEIKTYLTSGDKILVVSTQLIEAGVDLDFPVVFRALAPLESIIQSAGRCNREGKIPKCGGQFFLFNLQDGGMPDNTYKTCAFHAKNMLLDNPLLLEQHVFFQEYYSQILKLFIDADKFRINESRENFDFETVASQYRIIRNPTQALFIKDYNNESKKIFAEINHKEFISRSDRRRIEPYCVQVYPDFLKINVGWYDETQHGIKVWLGGYDSESGIMQDPEQNIEWIV